jgi:hypothetical protein
MVILHKRSYEAKDLGFLDSTLSFRSSNTSQTKSCFANQCVNSLPIVILNSWNLDHAVKKIIQICSKVHFLYPFAVCLLKLHLNHSAILTPNSTHLRYRTVMGVFGVVAGFFLAYRTH